MWFKALLSSLVLVFACCFFLPILAASSLLQSVSNVADRLISLLVEPQGQPIVTHLVQQYVSPTIFSYFSSGAWAMLGLLFVMVNALEVVDSKMASWNEALARQAKISPSLISHYCGGQYDQAFVTTGAASRKVRPK